MKNLLLLLILFAGFNGFSQSLEVKQEFVLNHILRQESKFPKLELSNSQKDIFQTSILNHLENGLSLYEGDIDTFSFFYKRKFNSNDDIFKKDSILVQYQIPKTDKNGEVLFDRNGNEINQLMDSQISFFNSFHKLNTNESWEFNNGKFTKTINSVGIDFIRPVKNGYYYETYYSNLKDSSEYILLKKDVNYTHYFYPEYYRTFLNNDTIWKNNYADYIEIGLKASAQNNQYEVIEFLDLLFNDFNSDKLKLYDIDTKQNITTNIVASREIIKKFSCFETFSLDESGEEIYNNDGEEIFTISSEIHPYHILGIEFYEDWYIGKDAFQLKKNLKGIILISAQYDKNYVLVGMKKIPAYISFE